MIKEFKPISDCIIDLVKSYIESQENGFIDRDHRTKVFEHYSPLIAMKELVLLSVGLPRGLGKSFGIAKLVKEILPNSLVIAPSARQADMVKEYYSEMDGPKTEGPPPQFIHPSKFYKRYLRDDLDAIIIDEWNTFSDKQKENLLMQFYPIAKKNPKFVILVLYSGF
jgi:hypothetical protein